MLATLLQDDGPEAPLQGTLPRWDFSTGPGLRSHQLATLRSMPSGDLPARTASGTVVDPVRLINWIFWFWGRK